MTDFTVSRPHPASASGSSSLPGLNLEDDVAEAEALVEVTQSDREAAAAFVRWQRGATDQWIATGEGAMQFFVADFSRAIMQGIWDEHPVVQAFARHRLSFAKEATPSASVEREPLVRIEGDDADEFSFHSDGGYGDAGITQHRYYRWGDTVIAIGEINYPNHWDDDAFNAQCAALEDALALPVPSAPQGDE